MKIAVIGGGIYGVTVAIRLARGGHEVELFEEKADLLQVASGINQYRLHRGYHYPRSADTIVSSLEAEPIFRAEYGEAVMDHNDHYYCIAREKSRVSGEEYRRVCDRYGLEYEVSTLDILNPNSVEICLKVKEALFDPSELRSLGWKRLREAGVKVNLNHRATASDVAKHDFVINCTYSTLNSFLEHLPSLHRDYQFELCEKPVVRLPDGFREKSIVIMDGPFTCVDPAGKSGLHLMGNVVHAIHATNVGRHPIVPEAFKSLLNQGVVSRPPITNFKKFISAATYFMPGIEEAEHVGSMYTIRTVLPNVDHTDTRPTLVDPVDSKIINVFSGKIGNCVTAADRVAELIKKAPEDSLLRRSENVTSSAA